jgi:hypothetical protein
MDWAYGNNSKSEFIGNLVWKPIRKRQLRKLRKQMIILRWILRKKVLRIGNITVLVSKECRTTAQAVSRRIPIVAARVRAQVRSCGTCGRQSGAGAGFLRVLRFPLPILIPPTVSHTSSIIRG